MRAFYTQEQKTKIVNTINDDRAKGMNMRDACRKSKVAQDTYRVWSGIKKKWKSASSAKPSKASVIIHGEIPEKRKYERKANVVIPQNHFAVVFTNLDNLQEVLRRGMQ